MKILIIGGIAGGMSVAFKARRENPNAEITVLEKENYISLGACGLPYYIGNIFSNEENLFVRNPEDARESGINMLEKHEALSVDFENKTVLVKNIIENKEFTLNYDQLVIATGAKPIIPNIDNINMPNVYTITKPNMATKLKNNLKNYKNIAIVGGGFIGVELADQLAKYKHLNIKLYQSGDGLLNKVYDKETGDIIKEELERLKVNIYFSERLTDINIENGLVKEIVTTNRKDKIDALILAIGFIPNIEIFQDSKLEKLKNGAIIIDKYGRTSIKDVWSVGDCATVPHKFLGNVHIPLGSSANKIGRQIGINLFATEDKLVSSYESLGSNAIKVGEMEIGSTGLTEESAKNLGYDYGIAQSIVRNKPSYMPDSTNINFKIIYEKPSYKILGARVFGKKDAVLRLQIFTTAIHGENTTKDLAYYDFAYSPPFNGVWDSINIASSVAK